MNIGIGVCSYKRPEHATSTCRSILATINKDAHNVTTVCSLDDTDTTGYSWISENFKLVHGKNEGVSYNKNRLVKYLAGNDFIFIVEDDVVFLKPGWVDLYLKAHKITGWHHFNYIVSHYREYISKLTQYSDITVGDSGPYVNGVLMVMSKKCLEVVGGFDSRYKGYGYEHVDYTNRCKKAKLHPEYNFHVMEATSYVDWLPMESCLSEEAKQHYIKENGKLFHAPILNIYNGSYKQAAYTCIT